MDEISRNYVYASSDRNYNTISITFASVQFNILDRNIPTVMLLKQNRFLRDAHAGEAMRSVANRPSRESEASGQREKFHGERRESCVCVERRILHTHTASRGH